MVGKLAHAGLNLRNLSEIALLDCFVAFISCEFILRTKAMRPNGGDVIFARTFLSASMLYLITIGIHDYTGSSSKFGFSLPQLVRDVHDTLPWFGAIFAVIYIALYARFAAQWSYLANMYNQIKAAEIRALASLADKKLSDDSELKQRLAEWKAGFIEDAENLHLATKKSIAPIVWFWFEDEAVKKAYKAATPGGTERCEPLREAVKKAVYRLGGIKGYDQ
jgi:hypothetical protein